MSKKFIVLDTEGYSTCEPYNIGYIVGDKKGNIYEQRNFAVLPALYENMEYKYEKKDIKGLQTAHEMLHRNGKEIMYNENSKYTIVHSADDVYTDLLNLITQYNIKRIWAYNCSFDENEMFHLFGYEKMTIIKNLVAFCDIIPAILYTRLLSTDYIEFCKSNNFLTEKGNIRTKAETVYRYLTGNLNFVEEHTALSDCLIEFQILLSAMNESKNLHRSPCQAWKILQKFCENEGIYIPALDDK